MSDKLKIYMCNGVGQASSPTYDYWTNNTTTYTNTQAVNGLLAKINLLNVEMQVLQLDEEQVLEHANTIDLYVVCLVAAQKYANNDVDLARAGHIIQELYNDGSFNYRNLEDASRASHLDSLCDTVITTTDSGRDNNAAGEFYNWFTKEVLPYNKVGLSSQQQEASKRFFASNPVSGPDWRDNADLAQFLNDAGGYFLYLFFTPETQARLPYYIRRKIDIQRKVYRTVCETFVPLYGTQDDLDNIIRTGILTQYKSQPEDVCKRLAQSKGVGFAEMTVGELIQIIVIVASIVLAAISLVLQYAASVVQAKWQAPENYADGLSSDSDWDGLKDQKKNGNLPLYLLAGVAILLLMKK